MLIPEQSEAVNTAPGRVASADEQQGYARAAARRSVSPNTVVCWAGPARQKLKAEAKKAPVGGMTAEEFVAQHRDLGGRVNRTDGYAPMASSLAGGWNR